MGLIKAGIGALGSTLADQWKEFFYCDALDKDTLVVKGQKRTSSRSSNTRGSDNIISNGSGIAVNEGQCMIIVEQGEIVEVCAEPGQFTYDKSTEPSVFAGSFGESLKQSFATLGRRFTFGGDTGKDQRVYYFNTKEIMDNKFGTPTPIMFHIVDKRIGLDMECDVRCNGVYSYRISDPLRFYKNVCANVTDAFRREEIDSQLKTEFVDALAAGFGALADLELRPAQINQHTKELKEAMNAELAGPWAQTRGLTIQSIAMNPVSISEEDAAYLKRYQRGYAAGRDPGMAGGVFLEQQGEAMRGAANNPNGAMNGFVGMGMGMNMGGATAANLFAMGQQQQMQQQQMQQQPPYGQQPQQPYGQQPQQPYGQQPYQPQQPAAPAAPAGESWTCACGTVAAGKFCPNCGQPKPAPAPTADGWQCSNCGTVNQGKFCQNCGQPKPAGAPLFRCDKCGWTPDDPHNPPRFCPECGDPFNDSDRQ